MPVEFWLTADKTKTLMVARTAASDSRDFCDELSEFIKAQEFASVAILTSGMCKFQPQEALGRPIPEVYAWANDFLSTKDYYDKVGVKKFGTWMQLKKPGSELKELSGDGWASRLFRTLKKLDMPCAIFMTFCKNAVDFVGGFVMFELI